MATTIEEMFASHWGLVHGYLTRRTANRSLAEELAQETFYRATRAFLGWRSILFREKHRLQLLVRDFDRRAVVARDAEDFARRINRSELDSLRPPVAVAQHCFVVIH